MPNPDRFELPSPLKGILLRDPSAGRWLSFDNPVDVLASRDPSRVLDILVETEQRVREEGLCAAGYRTYEASKPRPVPGWRMAESRPDYFGKIAAIEARIRAGDTYQINYTTRQVADGVNDPLALFHDIDAGLCQGLRAI